MSYVLNCHCGCGNAILFEETKETVWVYPQLSYFEAVNRNVKKDTIRRIRNNNPLCSVFLTSEQTADFLIWLAQKCYELKFCDTTTHNKSYSYIGFEYLEDDIFELEILPSVIKVNKNTRIESFLEISYDKVQLEELFNQIKLIYADAYGEDSDTCILSKVKKKQILLEKLEV